eukprot:2497158-Ditylum_brightwellii.AAC.1
MGEYNQWSRQTHPLKQGKKKIHQKKQGKKRKKSSSHSQSVNSGKNATPVPSKKVYNVNPSLPPPPPPNYHLY